MIFEGKYLLESVIIEIVPPPQSFKGLSMRILQEDVISFDILTEA